MCTSQVHNKTVLCQYYVDEAVTGITETRLETEHISLSVSFVTIARNYHVTLTMTLAFIKPLLNK